MFSQNFSEKESAKIRDIRDFRVEIKLMRDAFKYIVSTLFDTNEPIKSNCNYTHGDDGIKL